MVTPWSGWHTDVTAAVNPPFASILRGVTIPPYGGDTFWTNLVAAYRGMSPTMRGFVDGLRAVHANVARANPQPGQQYNERIQRRPLASEHPLVSVHAETGERVLFASPSYIKSIVGLTPREGQKLLELIWEDVSRAISRSGITGRPRTWRRPTSSSPISIASSTGSRWWASRWSASTAGLPQRSRECQSCPRPKSCG